MEKRRVKGRKRRSGRWLEIKEGVQRNKKIYIKRGGEERGRKLKIILEKIPTEREG